MDIIRLKPGEEIIIISEGSRISGFRKRDFVIRGIGGGFQVGRVGAGGKVTKLYFGKKKLFAGSIRGIVVGTTIQVGYEDDIINIEDIPKLEI